MAYSGFELSDADRSKLARVFPPKFPDFIGHHVTWEFGIDPANAVLPDMSGDLVVYGYCADESLECLMVEYNGSPHRPDGRLLHLTWSLDRAEGRKPVDSNKLIQSQKATLVTAINITTNPRFFT